MRDSNLVLISNAAASATEVGSIIDLGKGANTVDFEVALTVTYGSSTPTTSWTPKFEFSNDSGLSPVTYTVTLPAMSGDASNAVTTSMARRWRYLRVTMTKSGTVTSALKVMGSTGLAAADQNIKNS